MGGWTGGHALQDKDCTGVGLEAAQGGEESWAATWNLAPQAGPEATGHPKGQVALSQATEPRNAGGSGQVGASQGPRGLKRKKPLPHALC